VSNPTATDNFLVVARHLALHSATEIPDAEWSAAENARFRATISRAYYAAFLQLKYHLKSQIEAYGGCFPYKDRVHNAVLKAVEDVLARLNSPHKNTLPKKLWNLHRDRNAADYVWDARRAQRQADDSIENARVVMEQIARLSGRETDEIAKEIAAFSPASGLCPG